MGQAGGGTTVRELGWGGKSNLVGDRQRLRQRVPQNLAGWPTTFAP